MYKKKTTNSSINIIFTGFLAKDKINKIYKRCHFIILPSENEGFPKVIGEAMNYGCVPIVSNVSCIGQYIKNDTNGFLIEPNTAPTLLKIVENSLNIPKDKLHKMIIANFDLATKFTYTHYNSKIKQEIIEK